MSGETCQCYCCERWRSGANVESKLLSKDELKALEDAWLATLKHFKINRPVLPFEHMKLAALVKQYGVLAVQYAIVGMRFEEKTSTFDPAKHVGLSRLLDQRLFEKMLNLAGRQKTLQNEKA